ncbi:hypothetical protein I7331_35195, partial [Frankia sp. AgB1.8]|nr:hypothetical protein [Frankia sp. AgB1.8]
RGGELRDARAEESARCGNPPPPAAAGRPEHSGRTTDPNAWIILDEAWAFSVEFHGVFGGFEVEAWPQTSWTAPELAATPEHTYDAAYDLLREAHYPWDLPLNRPVEEIRAYLGQLGVPRHELMTTFFRGAPDDAPADPAIATEYLGLTPEAARLITSAAGPTPLPSTAACWGLQAAGNTIDDPADASAPPATGTWDEVLRRVSILQLRSRLRYDEVLDLLAARFVNPPAGSGATLEIRPAAGADPATCAPSRLLVSVVDTTLSPSDQSTVLAAAWDRLHRFVRLTRALSGWAGRDLDRAITAFAPATDGKPDLTTGFLVQLSHVERLRTRFRLPVAVVLSWWADLDTQAYVDHLADGAPTVPSLYTTLFSSRTAAGAALPADPDALSGLISDNLPAIAAGLQVSADDLALLRADPYVLPGAAPGTTTDQLTLATLSRLHRHATLARALRLPVRQYLSTLRLVAVDPFASTAATLDHVRQVDLIRASGATVDDLDYTLRATSPPGGPAPLTVEAATAMLDLIRADLRAVAAEHTFVSAVTDPDRATSDPSGDLTRRKLALLDWGAGVVDEVVAVLNDTFTHTAALPVLAPTVVIPEELRDRLSYDATAGQLRFVGTMTPDEATRLTAAPNTDAAFRQAVATLLQEPKRIAGRHLHRFSVPTFDAGLAALPAGFRLPDALRSVCYYNAVTRRLAFEGVMTDAERATLDRASAYPDYRNAVAALYDAPGTAAGAPAAADVFLTSAGAGNDIDALFDAPVPTPPERFVRVLATLLPYLRDTLGRRAVTQRLADALALDPAAAEALVGRWLPSPDLAGARAVADFLAPTFALSSPNLAATPAAFPAQFATVGLLHKISVLGTRLGWTSRQLDWVFQYGNGTWLDPRTLPAVPVGDAHDRYRRWARLAELARVRDALPGGETSLTELFAAATAPGAGLPAVHTVLHDRAGWDLDALTDLAASTAFDQAAADFATEAPLARLVDAFAALRQLGASASDVLTWTAPSPDYAALSATALGVRDLVRARLDETQWLDVAAALHGPLRDRRRAALVSYLTASLGLRDSAELYERLLIDVEMSPCMTTTRLKQAISSVQLFVQRGLMSLEDDVRLSPEEATEWARWRKQYRIWEANRQVLLYPENWLEPQLRDGKTPFFADLENELLQDDLTAATAEDAFLHYLEKLDQVARLDIVGLYHETGGAEPEVLHVIGRTHATPNLYFYRRLTAGVWSAWEKVDVDIEGDHLMPVVWNRRLHLFWAVFTEKTNTPSKDQRDAGADPTKYWEIKCAWSQLRNGVWEPKRISTTALQHNRHPWPTVQQEPRDFSFRTRFQQGLVGEQLSIECYGPVATDRPPVTTSGSASPQTNVEHIADFYQHRNAFGQPAGYQMVVRFQIEQAVPRPSEAGKITVELRRSSDHTLVASLTVDDHGETRQNGQNPIVNEDLYCELHSGSYAISTVSSKWEWIGLLGPGGIGVTVALAPWAPQPTTPGTVENVAPQVDPMQGIGEFIQDDVGGNVVAVPAAEAARPLSPPNLLPVFGTDITAMTLVENKDSTGALGRMAVLAATPGRAFRLLQGHQSDTGTNFSFPLFFQDDRRTYLLTYVAPTAASDQKVLFTAFFHARVPDFLRALNHQGIDGLLTLANQELADAPPAFADYLPGPLVDPRHPVEDVDFSYGGAYSAYNWELFFHIPFLIAVQLSQNQRFDDAQKWFHYIFDPTAAAAGDDGLGDPGPERFWQVKPLHDEAARGVRTLADLLGDPAELADQVAAWQADPFKPYVIARLRPAAYMKAVVMHYLDNLIAWADQLFRRDTIESINEATQLYVLAGEILGRRPERVRPRVTPVGQTLRTLDDLGPLDSLSNALVAVEGLLPPVDGPVVATDDQPPRPFTMSSFCLTGNDKLAGYWDTVADRLFKIRNCMNIDGVTRSLSIFEPPIDPGLLVRAAAAGVDLSSVVGDLNAPVPHYRFAVMLQKAIELCGEVQALGAALLAALEKRDAEALALLRAGHEVALLTAMRDVRKQQVDEAELSLDALRRSQDVVLARQDYYQTRPFMNAYELGQVGLTTLGLAFTAMQAGAETLAGGLHLIPELKGGAPTTVGATFGGRNVASAVQSFGSAAGATASILSTAASLSATLGGHQRRQDDWKHQADLATRELAQIAKQIAAGEVRATLAELEVRNHDLQVENSAAARDFLRDKFTNQALYGWMVGQLSSLHFQAYQLAYDAAKRAERAFRHELGLTDSAYVEFGYWDSLKKGLLAGERLRQSLRRLDVAFLEQNRREFEITKHVSLNALDPTALLALKRVGDCFVTLPEAIFDLDYPGHYLRRLKSVAVTIPCVAGPYASVSCTLTQHRSTVRQVGTLLDGAYGRQSDDDPRFTDTSGSMQAIVTSSAQNDPGLFEPTLRDDRLLPFEGTGAISEWRVELPTDFPAFDRDTISDVVLHVRYTARDGGDRLRGQARTELGAAVDAALRSAGQHGLARAFVLRHEFPADWHRFVSPPAGTGAPWTMPVGLEKARFPFLVQSKPIAIRAVSLLVLVAPDFVTDYVTNGELALSIVPGTTASTTALKVATWNGLLRGTSTTGGQLGDWTLAAWRVHNGVTVPVAPGSLEDVVVVVDYAVGAANPLRRSSPGDP